MSIKSQQVSQKFVQRFPNCHIPTYKANGVGWASCNWGVYKIITLRPVHISTAASAQQTFSTVWKILRHIRESNTPVPRSYSPNFNLYNELQSAKVSSGTYTPTRIKLQAYSAIFSLSGPLMVAQWLRYGATNRKIAGSIPGGVIGIFH
jgi:hypothetical protein